MKKIAFVDLHFHWPAHTGATIDFTKIIYYSKNKFNYNVKLFYPYMPPRGIVKEELNFPAEKIDFNHVTLNYYYVNKKFINSIDKYNPDIVFLGDGYPFKMHLASELSKKYKVILRCYAYELFCPLVFWFDRKKVINCDNTILKDHFACVKCFHKHHPFLTGLLKIPVYALKKFIPSDLYVKIDSMIGYNKIYHEFYGSLGFLPFFKDITLEAIKKSYIIANNDWISEVLGEYNKNIYIIPSGMDSDRFIPEQKKNNPVKRILLSGNVDIIKGHHILKEACTILWEKRHDFKMYITLDKKNSKYKEEFIQNMGWINHREIHKLYQESDICVVPSIWREGFPLVAIEAMASGTPVVASATRGLKLSILDGVTGYLVPPGNPEKLAEKLEYLLDNPNLREEMGKAGRKRFEENYSWEKIIEKYYIPLFENL